MEDWLIVAINRINATLSGVQPGGLAKIVPTSVAVGSGTGSVDSNGSVTFSGASSVSLNSCFNSIYQNYRIIINIDSVGVDRNLTFRFRKSGSDKTGANYSYYSFLYQSDNANASFYGQNQTSFKIGEYYSATSFYADIANPTSTTQYKNIVIPYAEGRSDFVRTGLCAGSWWSTDDADGFTIFASSGTISGNIKIYGYAQ